MQGLGSAVVGVSAIAIAALPTVLVHQNAPARAVRELSTPYHAVALVNDQVYFGKIDSLDAGHVALREALLIEPVKPDSLVAKLIIEQSRVAA